MQYTNLKEAFNKMKADEKVTYGTRSKKFYIIGKDDRDYNTKFSIDRKGIKALGFSEEAVKIKVVGVATLV